MLFCGLLLGFKLFNLCGKACEQRHVVRSGRTIFYDTKEVEEEEEAQKVRQIGTHMM